MRRNSKRNAKQEGEANTKMKIGRQKSVGEKIMGDYKPKKVRERGNRGIGS